MNNLELEAEAILAKLTIDELRTAAKVGIMLSLILYGRMIRVLMRTMSEVQENE